MVEAWTEEGEINVMRNALILDVFEGRGEKFASGFDVRDEGKDCWFFDPLETWELLLIKMWKTAGRCLGGRSEVWILVQEMSSTRCLIGHWMEEHWELEIGRKLAYRW